MVSLITTAFVAVRRIWLFGERLSRRPCHVHCKTYVTEKGKCWTRIRHASDRNVAENGEVAVDDANACSCESPFLDETAPRCPLTTTSLC